jgi:hypothetical protein
LPRTISAEPLPGSSTAAKMRTADTTSTYSTFNRSWAIATLPPPRSAWILWTPRSSTGRRISSTKWGYRGTRSATPATQQSAPSVCSLTLTLPAVRSSVMTCSTPDDRPRIGSPGELARLTPDKRRVHGTIRSSCRFCVTGFAAAPVRRSR